MMVGGDTPQEVNPYGDCVSPLFQQGCDLQRVEGLVMRRAARWSSKEKDAIYVQLVLRGGSDVQDRFFRLLRKVECSPGKHHVRIDLFGHPDPLGLPIDPGRVLPIRILPDTFDTWPDFHLGGNCRSDCP
jgi:hypothetical protein